MKVLDLRRLGLIGFLGVALLSRSGYSMNQDEYQASMRRLLDSRKQANEKLQALGIKLPSSPLSTSETSEKPAPLFDVHDDQKRLWAAPGKLLFGHIYNRLVVGGEESPVLVVLSGGQVSFSGLRVQGKARPAGTEGRLQLELQRVITREGKAIAIQAVGLDAAGALGLEAQVFSSKALAIGGALASSFISGLAATQQTQTSTAFGFSQVQPTGRNAILGGVAQTAADQSKRLLNEATQEKPTLAVEAGTAVTVYFIEEVRF